MYSLDCDDYEIARRAAKSVMSIYSGAGVICDDDFYDLWHEAYLEIAELRKKNTTKTNDYLFKAAQHAAKHWLMFWRFGAYRSKLRSSRTRACLCPILSGFEEEFGFHNKPVNWTGYDARSEFWESITDDKIRELLYKAKKRHSGIHNKALEDDLVLLRSIGEGLTNKQVAEKFSKSEEYIKSKRQTLKKILTRYAEEQGIKIDRTPIRRSKYYVPWKEK